MDIISSRLRAARAAKKLSQKELATMIGMDQGHLSRAERGERGLTSDQLRLATRALEVSADYLLGTDLNDRAAEYNTQEVQGEQGRLVASRSAPSGLRELAMNLELVRLLQITEAEWHALSSIVLPGEASRDGYVQLLFTVRAISHA